MKPRKEFLLDCEREYWAEIMRSVNMSVTRAAEIAGVRRTDAYAYMKRVGYQVPKHDLQGHIRWGRRRIRPHASLSAGQSTEVN